MGIKFDCPHCQGRLNVKAFLAGKRGVCPKCGGSITIPHESAEDPARGGEPGDVEVEHEVAGVPPSPPSPPSPRAPAGLAPAPAAPQPPAPQKAPRHPRPQPAAASGTSDPRAGRPPGHAPSAAPKARPDAAETSQPQTAAAASTTRQAARPAAPASAGPTAAGPTAADQGLLADPDAIWYVLPPEGGQYGPADGQLLGKWVAEGRVAPEAYLWRNGWEQWQRAADVLPALAGSPPPARPAAARPAPAGGTAQAAAPSGPTPRPALAPATEAPSPAAAQRYLRRKRDQRGTWALAVTLLGLVALALLITLIVVLQRNA